ncbi:MAG: class Ia ribonucleoside-diphosphate reductase subunit beta [Candidimonas sp.]
MAKTVFNTKQIDFTKQPMFFGEDQNTQRYDVFKYPIFDKLTQSQLSFFWRPEEVSLQKDRNDYLTFRDEQKFIYTSNLKYQTLLDSVQGRAPVIAFLPYCSLPELEACIETWSFFESIHSRSYTHIIKNVYSNPSETFDTILVDKAILERAESVTRYYDDFINYAQRWSVTGEGNMYDLKKKLYMALISVNILEGIRFYVSFACSFAFGELKLMEGSAKILQLIARDESQHLSITQHIIKNYKQYEGDKEMLDVIASSEKEVYGLYDEAVQQEKAWAKHLFKDGSIIGLNEILLSQYVEHMANRRMKAIGLDPVYDQGPNSNPLPWMQNWLSSKSQQVAPQETEISSYLIGSVKQDINTDTFKDFKL